MKKNLSYTELDRYTELDKNGFDEDNPDCRFGGENPLWLIDRGEIQKDKNFNERRF